VVTTAEESRPSPHGTLPARPKGWARVRPGTREVVALGIVALALLVPLRGLMRSQGPPMEEGFMLVFPERLLKGAIPNRDFLHLYGPGSLWVLAPIYKILGTDLRVERLMGLLQQAGVAFGVYFVARWWGRRVAVVSALIAIVIMLPPAGLTAFAWPGAIAFGLCGLAVGVHARAAPDPGRARVLAITSGILFGAAFLYRIDLVIAVALTIAVLVWRAPRVRAVALVTSAAATASLLVVQFVLAGFGPAFRGMVLDPVFKLRGGRRLPVPPSWGSYDGFLQDLADSRPRGWPLPTLAGPHQLFLWFFANLVAIGMLVGTGIWSMRRRPNALRSRVLLAAGVFSLGILPQTLQRPDSTHIAWVSCVSIGLVPIAIVELLAHREPSEWSTRHRRMLACAIPVAICVLVLPGFTVRPYGDFVLRSVGDLPRSQEIRRGDRYFLYANPVVVDAANELIPAVDSVARPGDRLFVGPTDLRRTVTSEAWLYHLFPEYAPGTRFIEMDPGVADARGSGLAHDLRTSDLVILSSIWDNWHEPNDSTKEGSPAAARVLRKDFCLVGKYGGTFRLYQKCNRESARGETPSVG